MLAKVSAFVQALLLDRDFENDGDIYQYVVLMVATGFGVLAYLGLFTLFLIEGMWQLCVLNALAVLGAASLFLTVRARKSYKTVGTLFSLMAMFTTTFHLVVIGTDTYCLFYYILVVVLQFITPYETRSYRGVLLSVMLVCLVATTVMGFRVEPLIPLQRVAIPLALFNVVVGLSGVGVELTLVSTVRRVVAGYNAKRLDEMTDQANSDALTGLYNRRYAYQFFDNLRTGRMGEKWCVAMMDIDNFKSLNDKYGHQAGDKVLATVAGVLTASLRRTDLVVRWGGEEFLMILQGTDLASAQTVLESLRQKIASTVIEVEGKSLQVTVTIGAAPLLLGDIDESLGSCDKKMYEGKSAGKNRVVI